MTEGKDRVAILLAAYNGVQFLSAQIDSVLAQTYGNIKLYIHDDGSSDNTLEIAEKYESSQRDKIVVFRDGIKCGGAKQNFIHLLKSVYGKSDYYMFCDQDDVWLPEKISVTLEKMKQSESDFGKIPILVHTDLTVVDKNLNVLSESMVRYQKIKISNNHSLLKLSLENTVTGCTVMINSALAGKLINIPSEAVMHDWWAGLTALVYGGKVIYLNKSTVLYRQHGKNSVGTQKTDLKYMFLKLTDIRNVFCQFRAAVQQQRKCGINYSLVTNLIIKAYLILRRMFSK